MSRDVDRMFRGDTMPTPVTSYDDIHRETIMESRMHPYHCTCADCAPRPVGESRFGLPAVIFAAIGMWALFGSFIAWLLIG